MKEEPYDLIGDKGRIKIASWENWLEYYWNLYKKTNKLKHLEKFHEYRKKIEGIESIAKQIIKDSTKQIISDEADELVKKFRKDNDLEEPVEKAKKFRDLDLAIALRRVADKNTEKQKQK